jgi:hypothetical protein
VTRASTSSLLERLGDVVHATGLKAPYLVPDVGERGHEDHGDVGGFRAFPELTTGLESIHTRHHHVQQHQVRASIPRLRHCAASVPCHKHPEAHAVQGVEQQTDIGGCVIDDENGLLLGHLYFSRLINSPRDKYEV